MPVSLPPLAAVVNASRQTHQSEKNLLEIRPSGSATTGVSFAELKPVVDSLSLEERLELADYLRRRTKQDKPQWEAELAQRLDRCLEGKGHTADELMALHERLHD